MVEGCFVCCSRLHSVRTGCDRKLCVPCIRKINFSNETSCPICHKYIYECVQFQEHYAIEYDQEQEEEEQQQRKNDAKN